MPSGGRNSWHTTLAGAIGTIELSCIRRTGIAFICMFIAVVGSLSIVLADTSWVYRRLRRKEYKKESSICVHAFTRGGLLAVAFFIIDVVWLEAREMLGPDTEE